MRLLIMGPPGAGKGTQAVLIEKAYNIPHISTGDMFREAISNKTPVGLKAKSFIDKGELVPDSVTIEIVRERLQQDDARNQGFLLDGFPRTTVQAIALDEILAELGMKIDMAINIVVDDKTIVERIVGRRVCVSCGEVYHIQNKKPSLEGICDKCGGKLIQRADDTEETIVNRLKVYNLQTKPLIEYYQEKKLIKDVGGLGRAEDSFEKIQNLLGGIDDNN